MCADSYLGLKRVIGHPLSVLLDHYDQEVCTTRDGFDQPSFELYNQISIRVERVRYYDPIVELRLDTERIFYSSIKWLY